jgi:hypothetical protein
VLQARQGVVDNFRRPVDADDPSWNRALEDVREVQSYMAKLRDAMSTQKLGEFGTSLRSLARGVPAFVPQEGLKALKADVDVWAPALDHLAEHLDFHDRRMWVDRLDKVRAG